MKNDNTGSLQYCCGLCLRLAGTACLLAVAITVFVLPEVARRESESLRRDALSEAAQWRGMVDDRLAAESAAWRTVAQAEIAAARTDAMHEVRQARAQAMGQLLWLRVMSIEPTLFTAREQMVALNTDARKVLAESGATIRDAHASMEALYLEVSALVQTANVNLRSGAEVVGAAEKVAPSIAASTDKTLRNVEAITRPPSLIIRALKVVLKVVWPF